MPTIYSPVADHSGKVAGVNFVDGKATTNAPQALAYFRRHGYGIGRKPAVTAPGPSPAGPAQTSTAPAVDAANHPDLTPTTTTPVGPAGGADATYDPSTHSVEEVNDHIANLEDSDSVQAVLVAEQAGKARKGVLEGPHVPKTDA